MTEAIHVVTTAIHSAMMWNVRAYGKLAGEEDAEFFALLALRALKDAGYEVLPPVPPRSVSPEET